jgi:nucleoside phosphorylase
MGDRVAINEARSDGICAAIQRAKTQGRSLYLVVDKKGLFDISDKMPSTPLSLAHLTSETLQDLLDQKALTRITPRDCFTGSAKNKLSSREKDILALGLARCLMEFFDANIELALHSWRPECVYFLRSTRGHARDRILYISLKPLGPASSEESPVQSASPVGPGNPVLLSFARLLLEIENGENIALEVKPDRRANLPSWGEMCDIVERIESEGGGNYLQAVKGCLYLHIALRKIQNEAVDLSLSDLLRKTIYEQIVHRLEANVNPEKYKRKRRDSVTEIPLAKKLSLAPPAPSSTPNPIQVHPEKRNHPTDRKDFEIAIVCALPLEYDAVAGLVDEFWDTDFGCADGDPNIYTHGRIGKFNVVLLVLPSMGKVSAAGSSASLRLSYPRLSIVLLTGICGGVPFPVSGEKILLGDVVISRHIVQYDLGRRYPNEFKTKDTAEDTYGRASPGVRRLLTLLQTHTASEKMESLTARYLQDLQSKSARKRRGPNYDFPGASEDRVFQPNYHHERHASHSLSLSSVIHKMQDSSQSYNVSCEEARCDLGKLIPRERVEQKQLLEKQGRIAEAQAPLIFIGTIGSADTVMKSGEERDRIASLHNLIAFEMEGAGLWDETPCLVVKAVCDYADSHKNKKWQNFAAATAASATKALLDFYVHREPSR